MAAYTTSAEYATFAGSANITATAAATVAAGAVNALAIGAGGLTMSETLLIGGGGPR